VVCLAILNSVTTSISESPVGTVRLVRNLFAVRLGSKNKGINNGGCVGVIEGLRMNCRLIKHRPYRTPILCEERLSVLELLNLELLWFASKLGG
jgi:hypothetical protein